jgi:hypothetical protein
MLTLSALKGDYCSLHIYWHSRDQQILGVADLICQSIPGTGYGTRSQTRIEKSPSANQ